MNDFANLEKLIVRELSCRLCLCTDVVKLKPLSEELKRKIKRLFNVAVRHDDNLPKAICHDCLHHVSTMHLYSVKVEKTQKFLNFHKMKTLEEKREREMSPYEKSRSDGSPPMLQHVAEPEVKPKKSPKSDSPPAENQQGDAKHTKKAAVKKKISATEMKYLESMTLEEFAKTEKVDKTFLASNSNVRTDKPPIVRKDIKPVESKAEVEDYSHETLDPIVLVDGRPARQGAALDRQITLFYKMECCICHEKGFHFKSLMKHYKERHGVPGYVTCCDKKFHYFYPKKIIEHMAFHLQPNIFMCRSCHQNFQTSMELHDHQINGGRSEGKILCPRCTEKFPTYRELGWHIITHRIEKNSCDYCGKSLKHHHRKKTVNNMEDVVLCSQCLRTLRNIEKQEKEIKEKVKAKSNNDVVSLQKRNKFREALDLSAEEGSSD